jgi:hypothetical protein
MGVGMGGWGYVMRRGVGVKVGWVGRWGDEREGAREYCVSRSVSQ